MKNYSKYLLISTFITFWACNDFLDKEPLNMFTPDNVEQIPEAGAVRGAVNAIYPVFSNTLNFFSGWKWQEGLVTNNDVWMYELAGQDMQRKWNMDGDQAHLDELYNHSYMATQPTFQGAWTYYFEGVNRCNVALNYLIDPVVREKLSGEISEVEFNSMEGQVRVLRAMCNFNIVDNFGAAPLIKSTVSEFDQAYQYAVRNSQDSIWDFVRLDLEKAVNLLPNSMYSDDTEKWRVSKGVAIAMLAKTALYNKDYTACLSYISQLDTLGYYSLETDYLDPFLVTNEFPTGKTEVIFAFNHESNRTPDIGNGYCAIINWGFLAPTQSMINAYEENDPRFGWTYNLEKKDAYKIIGGTDRTNSGDWQSPSNQIYIRYGDVLLWKAECLIMNGQVAEGVTFINQIRERARNSATITGEPVPEGTLPDRPTNITQDQAMDFLVHERRIELACEMHRFRDLRRWGLARCQAVLSNFTEKNLLYPIPQSEIDKSGAYLTQNPGY